MHRHGVLWCPLGGQRTGGAHMPLGPLPADEVGEHRGLHERMHEPKAVGFQESGSCQDAVLRERGVRCDSRKRGDSAEPAALAQHRHAARERERARAQSSQPGHHRPGDGLGHSSRHGVGIGHRAGPPPAAEVAQQLHDEERVASGRVDARGDEAVVHRAHFRAGGLEQVEAGVDVDVAGLLVVVPDVLCARVAGEGPVELLERDLHG